MPCSRYNACVNLSLIMWRDVHEVKRYIMNQFVSIVKFHPYIKTYKFLMKWLEK